jgi:hypothetical protein
MLCLIGNGIADNDRFDLIRFFIFRLEQRGYPDSIGYTFG